MSRLPLVLLSAVLAMTTASDLPAAGRDWFVRAGATGDGTRDNPAGDPWEALAKCEAGDAIHIAEGRYTGKLQSGEWAIPFDGVQLIGGYNGDWSQRDPWKFKTQLVWDINSKNRPKGSRLEANVRNAVIDGLVFDCMEQNEYVDDQRTGRSDRSLSNGEAAVRLVLPGTVRNCVFVNTGREGVVCPCGSTIENNLFLNTFDGALKINSLPSASPESKNPAIVRNNTFAWSWCDRAPGKGRYSGSGIQMGGPATITNNIFAHCDNNGIYCTINPERTSITHNVFFMNLWSNFKMFVEGRDVPVDDKTMDLLEECGLKAFEGNESTNPELPLDPTWLDATAKRTSAVRGKVEMDDWNKLRQAMGLNLAGSGGAPASGLAPVYPLDKVAALMAPKKSGLKAGARVVALPVKFSAGATAGPAKSYTKAEITAWAQQPDTVDGKDLEMTVAISSVANTSAIPANYKQSEHEGIFLHDQNGTVRVVGFYKKGSSANRTVNENSGFYNGSGKATRLLTVKGTAHAVKGVPKAAFYIESIALFEASAVALKRAVGRDWFVRAGSSGGDGTKDKPLRDPFQALERSEAGDTIHVATGEYVGKLRMGYWRIDCPDIALIGGYDKDFTTRDPWKNPCLLYTPADYKGARNNYTIEGDGDHTGCIVDGFVFDKKLNNQYQANGDLMYSQSEKKLHLRLLRPDCAVRNCVFVNGSEGAIEVTAGSVVENCIFLNHYQQAVRARAGHAPTRPFVFRNNTVAFSWEPKFGFGHGRQGDLLWLNDGQLLAVVDNNIFEFADNHAIRMDADPKFVELTNNVFAHNLWAEVYRTTDSQVVDNQNFNDLRQLGFKKVENNQLMTPGLPLDQKWFDVYMNRTAYVQGKVQMDDWNKLREILGQPLLATGGEADTGVAPAYDWKKALELFPKNPACKADARSVKLDVKFEGIARTEEQHEYTETTWEVAANATEWGKLDGKRVMLKIAIKNEDNQWLLPGVNKEERSVWQVGGPEGGNSPGLPMRVYVLRGTRFERVFRQAKGYTTANALETHIIKGIAKLNRQLLVEAVEKAD